METNSKYKVKTQQSLRNQLDFSENSKCLLLKMTHLDFGRTFRFHFNIT